MFRLKSMLGNRSFEYACSLDRGRSGGLISEVFNNFINDSNLTDLPLGCYSFTWMKKQGTKLSKLDPLIISEEVINLLPYIRITTLDRLWFDHIPILLHCCKHDFGPVPFKIYHSWFSRKGFDEASSAFNDDRESRINLVQEVDNLTNQKRRSNSINGISHEGVWVLEPHLIKEVFINFFKKKFQANDSLIDFLSTSTSSRLNDFDRALLEPNVSFNEIKDAVWDCGSNKAPGPDGYTFAFIKRYWDLLKTHIHDFVASFLASKKMPLGSNSSFITLIPKVSNPIHVNDFWPISLINTHYKIIAKVLANRLSKVVDKIVSREQTAFIAGR
ncbi:hypothetical protein Tco_1062618 [Tanacetum coccineum]